MESGSHAKDLRRELRAIVSDESTIPDTGWVSNVVVRSRANGSDRPLVVLDCGDNMTHFRNRCGNEWGVGARLRVAIARLVGALGCGFAIAQLYWGLPVLFQSVQQQPQGNFSPICIVPERT